MIILGIDPGASGGLAILRHGELPIAIPMPETERDIWLWISEWSPFTIAVIEKQQPLPSSMRGAVASMKLGRSYGFLRGCLVAGDIPFEEWSPGAWQLELRCRSGGDKKVTKAAAQQMFPRVQDGEGNLKKITHKTADALLIAAFARRLYMQRINKGKMTEGKLIEATKGGQK